MGGLTTDGPAVWAGPECAFLTVGTWACDQLTLTGHDGRPDDIDRLASLGARAVRYPILWGRHRGTQAATDWGWAEDRLARLAAHSIRPVIGLLHHGFGPGDTDPSEPGWAEAFGRYAAAVASRAPSGSAFLPVNEPLTTARFGGLYGWWPPYARDPEAFATLLLAQCRGYVEAARAVRAVRPDATIAMNEDIGRTFGSVGCRDVAARHNERRWLTFDLVTGRVDRSHPAWSALGRTPANRRALAALQAEPEPPDVLGIDHYVTSDRYLDDRVEQFPEWTHAVDGTRVYADVELARVESFAVDGFARAIDDTWTRYGLPMALTEVQLAGEPDDQLTWWAEAWAAASEASSRGIPIAAVTAWAVFGAFDWSTVLRTPNGRYEPGCFDISGDGPPQPTPLAALVGATAAGRAGRPGVGWWRRDDRIAYRVAGGADLVESA